MIRANGGEAPAPPADPVLRAVFDALAARGETFIVDPAREGLDVACGNEVAGARNRARIKAFVPRASTLVVFLYKDSQVPFSDDRFSYGAMIAKGNPPSLTDLAATIDYAVSGLHPRARPDVVKRTFPFTVPR